MFEKLRGDKVASILRTAQPSPRDRIQKLMKLREDARAEQRLASESGMVYDDRLNADLRNIHIALDSLDEQPALEADKKAAML